MSVVLPSAFHSLLAMLLLIATLAGSPAKAATVEQPTIATEPIPAPTHPIVAKPSRAELARFRQRLLLARPPQAVTTGRCFHAAYPNPIWTETACGPASTRRNDVGDGVDAFASVSSGAHITRGSGAFDTADVKGETAIRADTGKWADNVYSVQLNTNNFSSPACKSAVGCLGEQQFVYSKSQCPKNKDCLFIEYWLLNGVKPCPAKWSYSPGPGTPGCYYNTPVTSLPVQSLSELQGLFLQAFSTAAEDGMIVETAAGDVYWNSHPNQLGLDKAWTILEFNLVGDCCARGALFYNGASTLKLNADIDTDSSATLSCANSTTSEFTLETNNLTLGSCTTSGMTMSFSEQGGTPVPVTTPLTCSQLQADIASEEKIITQETEHPPPCPSKIVSICSQTKAADEANLAKLRSQYAKQCHH